MRCGTVNPPVYPGHELPVSSCQPGPAEGALTEGVQVAASGDPTGPGERANRRDWLAPGVAAGVSDRSPLHHDHLD